MKIHQILTALSYGDAISNEAIEIRDSLRRMGYHSDIFAKYIHPKVSKYTKNLNEYKKNADNIVIYHFPLAGFEVTEFVKQLPDIKILIYHNFTPHYFFKNINNNLYNACIHGSDELKTLRNIVKLALGDSEYNKNELEDYGFYNTGILPILIDYSKYNKAPNRKIITKYNDDYINLIFVGRIAPNKMQEDLIKIFYYYKKINPKSRLFLVGSYNGMEKYVLQLKEMVKKFGLNDVIFTGHTSFDSMIAYYHLADVFLCMSGHEGFCVPLLESMYFNIPIVAYNSTAVPYTLGNSGILVYEKRYDEVAEIINLLINDESLKQKIVKKQKERFKDFDKSKTEEKLKNYIETLINSTIKE
jgi:glycosyltransferase involved in cell wall biosynthesis